MTSTNKYCFQNEVYAKGLESPETFVEIPQKLEVSNKTIQRFQVFLHL
jgi:hypothetical protein